MAFLAAATCAGWAGMAIFDRSWYGRVLVERVEQLVRPVDWQRAYTEINHFERNLTDAGAIVIKFWLSIDSEGAVVTLQCASGNAT